MAKPEKKMTRITIDNISVDVPPQWSLTTAILAGPLEEPSATSRFLGPQTPSQFQQNVVVVREPVGGNVTVDSYFGRQVESLKREGISRHEAGKVKKLTIDGVDALQTEQIIVAPTGERVRQMQLMTIKGGFAYTLIASHLEGEPFERSRASFEHILTSFR